jgi:hypothetical protein
MKAVRHITLLLLYLYVTVGITVATHFCAGEPVSATLLAGGRQAASCCCEDAEDMEGCCDTSVSTLRVDDVHTTPADASGTDLVIGLVAQTAGPAQESAPRSFHAGASTRPGPAVSPVLLGCSLLI